MDLTKLNSFSFYIWVRQFSILTLSSALYLVAGLFFLKSNKDILLISKLYEPALNFLILTTSVQITMSFLSCAYLYRRYVQRIRKPISEIESYLNSLTKQDNSDTKLQIGKTFSNIKRVSLLIKVLVSFWKIEHIKQNKKINKLSKQNKNKNKKDTAREAA